MLTKIEVVYKNHQNSKKLIYEQGIVDVEHARFNTSVLPVLEGPDYRPRVLLKRQADKISQEKDDSFADVIAYARTKLTSALIGSSVLCICR